MVSKKILKVMTGALLVSSLFLTACTGASSSSKEESKKEDGKKKIGITQIIEHGALDEAREGFIEGLKEALVKLRELIREDNKNEGNK